MPVYTAAADGHSSLGPKALLADLPLEEVWCSFARVLTATLEPVS